MAIGAQALTIDPGERYRVADLVAGELEHLGDHGSRCNLDQHDMIQSNAIETILERDYPLNLMRLDHCRQHISHRQRRSTRGKGVT